jgi:hypothetical protein
MTPAAAAFVTSNDPTTAMIQQQLDNTIENVLNRLPDPEGLSPEQRRGIIARYAAVLEGNFIYWMTGAYLAVSSEAARAKISDNLREEIRDWHDAALCHRRRRRTVGRRRTGGLSQPDQRASIHRTARSGAHRRHDGLL